MVWWRCDDLWLWPLFISSDPQYPVIPPPSIQTLHVTQWKSCTIEFLKSVPAVPFSCTIKLHRLLIITHCTTHGAQCRFFKNMATQCTIKLHTIKLQRGCSISSDPAPNQGLASHLRLGNLSFLLHTWIFSGFEMDF